MSFSRPFPAALSLALSLLIFAGGFARPLEAAEPIKVKLAILPPEGTTWGAYVKEGADQIEKETQNRVKVTLFAGGSMGDEPDVVRKLRLGQIQSAGLTGMGLGLLASEVRVLELPLLLKDYKEASHLTGQLFDYLKQKFDEKGITLLGLSPYGGIYLFTQKPVRKLTDIAGEKAWVWAGDPLAEAIYREIGVVTPVPLPVIEVLTALRTGLVNSFYINPLGAIALQWYPHAKFIVDTPLTMATSGFVMDKKTFLSLSKADQIAVEKIIQTMVVRLSEQVERENEIALRGLNKQGLRFVKMDPEGMNEFKAQMEQVYQKLAGVLYPKSLLERVQKLLSEYRAAKP